MTTVQPPIMPNAAASADWKCQQITSVDKLAGSPECGFCHGLGRGMKRADNGTGPALGKCTGDWSPDAAAALKYVRRKNCAALTMPADVDLINGTGCGFCLTKGEGV